jgi:transcriptional regulator GlxA family with amidase domain
MQGQTPLQNPFQHRLRLTNSLEQSKASLQTVLPIASIAATNASEPWWHHHDNLCIGSMVSNASLLAPMRLSINVQVDLTAVVVYAGILNVEQGGRRLSFADQGLLILSGAAWSCESSSSSSLVMLHLERDRLQRIAMAMAEQRSLPQSWRERLEPRGPWQPDDSSASQALLSSLREVLAMASQLSEQSEALLERLELDLLIYRLLAALVVPELRESDSLGRLRSRRREGGDRFEELITYLEEHLHEPLSLHQLEARSHYSRRALQYAFLEKLGCSPTQWIRSMRLERARRWLQQPQPGETVTRIAQACGYRSLNLFSMDFQQRFHVKPSELLRESLGKQPAEPLANPAAPLEPDPLNEV